MQQIPLNIQFDKELSLSSFLVGKNSLALDVLRATSDSSSGEFIYLWGEAGTGKSHLLQALANRYTEVTPIYLPMTEPGLLPEVLNGLEAFSWILLDDIDAVLGSAEWEEALFHLYNKVKQMDGNLVVATNAAPNGFDIELKDLQSRLTAMTVFRLQLLSDEEKLLLIQKHAKVKGLSLPNDVAKFVLSRNSRDLRHLLDAIDTLDQASLAQQRKLTVPFVKQVLHL